MACLRAVVLTLLFFKSIAFFSPAIASQLSTTLKAGSAEPVTQGGPITEHASLHPTEPPNFQCQSITLLSATQWDFEWSGARFHAQIPAGPLIATQIDGEWVGVADDRLITRGKAKSTPIDPNHVIVIALVALKDNSTTMQGRMYLGAMKFLSAPVRDAKFTVSPCGSVQPKLQ